MNTLLELVEGTTVSIMDMMHEGRLEVGVIRTPVDGSADDLAIRNVEQDDLIAVLPRAHALAKRKRIMVSLATRREGVLLAAAKPCDCMVGEA